MQFKGNDLDSVYRDVATYLMGSAPLINARVRTAEIMNAQLHILDPRRRVLNSHARDMSMRYLIGELCFYLAARRDLASIAYYSKFWEHVSDDGLTVNSAYGHRLFSVDNQPQEQSQFEYALTCLEDDIFTRKAVMMIYALTDARKSKDNPCTICLQFFAREGALHLTVTMRSQDFWLGIPYDVAFFALVQEMMLVELQRTYPDLKLGFYTHNVGSLHAYERDWEGVESVSRDAGHASTLMPALCEIDMDDWFNDLLTYEKSKRGKVLYKEESRRTAFQDWAKQYI